LCVVLCSNGYPDKYEKNVKIDNLENIILDENNFLFHAGTKEIDKETYAIGGRVLNLISLSDNFLKARNDIHLNLQKLNWNNGFYRKDIGFNVIDQ
jgi:phosphoribosylamine--glycine ligase